MNLTAAMSRRGQGRDSHRAKKRALSPVGSIVLLDDFIPIYSCITKKIRPLFLSVNPNRLVHLAPRLSGPDTFFVLAPAGSYRITA